MEGSSAPLAGAFVPGTSVHTRNGLTSIERIRPGDEVLSTDESGGRQFRKVTRAVSGKGGKVAVIRYFEGGADDWRPDRPAHILYASPSQLIHTTDGPRAANRLVDTTLATAMPTSATVWDVRNAIRMPVADVAWVCEHQREYRPAFVVDMRRGCGFWKYPAWRQHQASVPFIDSVTQAIDGLFEVGAMASIFESRGKDFTTTLWNLEVEGGGGYCVGEFGIRVTGIEAVPEHRTATSDQFAGYADGFLDTHASTYGNRLDCSVSTLQAVDMQYLAFLRVHELPEDYMDLQLFTIGCLLGEVFVRNGHGAWVPTAGTPLRERTDSTHVIRAGATSFFDPLGKVVRRRGEDDPESLDRYCERVLAALRRGDALVEGGAGS